MKLYYAPGACSLSPHIVLCEAGLPVELIKVDLGSKRTADGADFRKINGKGYVPAIELENGQYLTEGPAIVQYIADKVPERRLIPAAGTLERYRAIEWLNFISTELHKQYSPLFDSTLDAGLRTRQRERVQNRLEWVAGQLGANPYLMGKDFTVADAYLFTVLSWNGHVGIDLAKWPTLATYQARVGARTNVRTAMRAEGLLGAAG